MAQLLSGPVLPTAVFAEYTNWRWGRSGRYAGSASRCPERLSVVGIDDHELAQVLDLTTVAQDAHERARSPPSYCCKPWRHRRTTSRTPTSSSRPTSSSAPAQPPTPNPPQTLTPPPLTIGLWSPDAEVLMVGGLSLR